MVELVLMEPWGTPEGARAQMGPPYLPSVLMKQWSAGRREEDFSAPLPGAPNVGYRVLAKPLRFELWGAREVLSLLPIYALAR